MSSTSQPCPGCGLVAADGPIPAPPTFRASPGCWQTYGELLARSYADADHRAVHQLVVDAYVAQHPTSATRRQTQQVALCLMTLQLFLEHGHDVAHGPALHQRMVANLPALHALDPPDTVTGITVQDVVATRDATTHRRLVRAWAHEVWDAWQPHHGTVRRWNEQALG